MDAVALYRAEKEKNRKNKILRRFEYARPLCGYCGQYTAHNLGTERADGSKMLRKYKGIPECGRCYSQRRGASSQHPYAPRKDVLAY